MSYGGTDSEDNSGSLNYVRVWYGGALFADATGRGAPVTGAIHFGAVGSGTYVENIEASFSGHDGVACYGGSVDIK